MLTINLSFEFKRDISWAKIKSAAKFIALMASACLISHGIHLGVPIQGRGQPGAIVRSASAISHGGD
jgi:hypothetical protein